MTDYLPTPAHLTATHADPAIATAAEIVTELVANGLNYSEIGRLCGLEGRTATFRALQAGTAKTVRPETVAALQRGYQRFLDGDRSYRKPRGTHPNLDGRTALPDTSTPQPQMLNPRSQLVERLAQKRRDAA